MAGYASGNFQQTVAVYLQERIYGCWWQLLGDMKLVRVWNSRGKEQRMQMNLHRPSKLEALASAGGIQFCKLFWWNKWIVWGKLQTGSWILPDHSRSSPLYFADCRHKEVVQGSKPYKPAKRNLHLKPSGCGFHMKRKVTFSVIGQSSWEISELGYCL